MFRLQGLLATFHPPGELHQQLYEGASQNKAAVTIPAPWGGGTQRSKTQM